MKKILLLLILLIALLGSSFVYAQHTPDKSNVFDSGAQWTWMSGDNAVQQFGTYGTKGVEVATNKPGTVLSPACWKDKYGKLWMFGGQGYAASPNNGDHNDLWRYNPSNNQWTWMGGTSSVNQFGVYGTKRVPSKTNVPGGRRNAAYWTDTAGNFWLFGGYGYAASGALSRLNDLWVYSPKDSTWTWISGSNAATPVGVYGTKGVAAPSNAPGGRGYPNAAVWVDANNNVWLFGGYGQSKTSTPGYLNDLWKYNPVDTTWTWMGGRDTINQVGVYSATPGPASTSYFPGARGGSTSWTDASGNLWMFGGAGANSAAVFSGSALTTERISELWKYNPTTGEWTWVGGSNIYGSTNLGNYGTRNVTAPTNWPGGRSQPGAWWTDAQDNFYFLGGYGWPASGVIGGLNDIWKYNPTSGLWTWIDGSNVITKNGIYGTKGTQSPLNDPGATTQGGQWCDSGNLWYFGGSGLGASGSTITFLNHLWRYAQPVTCAVTANVTVVRPTTFCTGDSVILIANAGTGYTYQWSNASGTITNATDDSLIVKAGGSYTVTVVNTNGNCNATSTATVVTVNALPNITISPATAVICNGKDTALTANNGTTYTWLPNIYTGSGATIRATATGTTTYTVTGTDGNGCKNTATRTVIVNALPNITITPATAAICTGNDTALTGNGGTSYTWAPTGSGTTVRVSPTVLTTYTVTGTDANGCTNTATRSVTVNALPNISITPATAVVCSGKDTALTGNGGVSYTWLPNVYTGSGATIHANPAAPTTYTVTGTDANGCQSTATRTVTVNTSPLAGITGNAVLCSNGTLTLTGTPTMGNWSSSNTSAATINGTGTITGVAGGSTTITYTVTDVNNCSNSTTKAITVNAAPPVPNPITGRLSLCVGDTTTLLCSTTGGSWSSSMAFATINATTGKVQTNSAGSTVITYSVINVNNCTNSISSNLTVYSLPNAPTAITGATDVCVGASATLVSTPNNGVWSTNATNILAINASTGVMTGGAVGTATITYKITDVNSCSNSITTNVDVNGNPSVTLTPSGTVGYCEGTSVTINTAISGSGITYQWQDANGNIPNATTASYVATTPGNYQVVITDFNGCVDTSDADTVVEYIVITPVITRNGQTLSTGTGYTSYQWYANGLSVNGATQPTCIVTQNGIYYVVVTDSNGCSKTSKPDTVTDLAVTIVNRNEANDIRVYPNPANTTVHIVSTVPVNVQVLSIDGKLMIQQNDAKTIDVINLSSGVYMMRFLDKNGIFIKAEKLLKTAD